MGTNTDSEQELYFARVCCGEYYRPLYEMFRGSEIDPFQIGATVKELLVDTTMRCFNGEGPTLLALLQRHRKLRVRRTDLMEILVGFEDYIYIERAFERIRHGSVVDVKFLYDSTVLEVAYYETVSKEEPQSFSRFVRQLKQNGEAIHPEVERLLERFRAALDHSAAVQRTSRVPVSSRRSRRR